jgi:hypothetical protein
VKITEKEGLVVVTRTMLGEQTELKREKIKIRPFVTDTATVGVNYKSTINLGNYENVGLSVFISVPCYKEEIVNVFRQVEKLGTDLMLEQVSQVKPNA